MNDAAHVIWENLLSSGKVKYQFTHPDGQVEVKS